MGDPSNYPGDPGDNSNDGSDIYSDGSGEWYDDSNRLPSFNSSHNTIEDAVPGTTFGTLPNHLVKNSNIF